MNRLGYDYLDFEMAIYEICVQATDIGRGVGGEKITRHKGNPKMTS